MLLNSKIKFKVSLISTESRENLLREDYPKIDYKNWIAWVVFDKDKNKIDRIKY